MNICIGCAACCRGYRVAFHWSETTDFPGGTVPAELTEPVRPHEVAMRGTSARSPSCIALTGQDGIDLRCSIHGRHPSVCREVRVGDPQCVKARLAHGLPAPTARQLAEARGG